MAEHGVVQKFSIEYVTGLKRILDSLPMEDIQTVISYLTEAYEEDRHIFVIGNGGSAATASHMACDLAKTVLGNSTPGRAKRFRIIPLTDNVPLITAWGNDVDYDLIFAEQLRTLARPNDLLLVITGSGNSPNIVEAVNVAKELELQSVGLLGFDGGRVKGLVDHAITIESNNYGHIEDVHMILNHLITAYFKMVFASLESPLHQTQIP